MSSDAGAGGPRFPGELSEYLGRKDAPEPPDRWADRFKHAWFVYLLVTGLFLLWGGAIAAVLVYARPGGWFLAVLIGMIPVAVYARILQWRYVSGRDPETGEKWRPHDR